MTGYIKDNHDKVEKVEVTMEHGAKDVAIFFIERRQSVSVRTAEISFCARCINVCGWIDVGDGTKTARLLSFQIYGNAQTAKAH